MESKVRNADCEKHRITISSETQNKRFSFEEVLIKDFYEANAVGVDENQLIDEFAPCFESMTPQNRTVLIAALWGDQKLNGFKELLNYLLKTERIDEIEEGRLRLSSDEKCHFQQTQERRSTLEYT